MAFLTRLVVLYVVYEIFHIIYVFQIDGPTMAKKKNKDATEPPKTSLNKVLLIDTVRMHPCLYDLSHAEYHRNDIKQQVWTNIGASFGCTRLLITFCST